jgi:hypothetical protein
VIKVEAKLLAYMDTNPKQVVAHSSCTNSSRTLSKKLKGKQKLKVMIAIWIGKY